jgi:hypothetical protein
MPTEPVRVVEHQMPGAKYDIAVNRVSGALRAEWTCQACGAKDYYGMPCATIDDAVQYAMLDISIRHDQRHRPKSKPSGT